MNGAVGVIFIGVALTLVTLVLALSGGAAGRMRKRAEGVKKRAKGGGRPTSVLAPGAASVKRSQGRSVPVVEDLAKRFLPRQTVLRDRLSRTGHAISIGMYALINLGVALFAFLVMWLFSGLPAPVCGALGLSVGVGVPHMTVGVLAARRQKKFIAILPDAVDLIVRGLRSGLPVTESIATVGREMEDQVGVEFRRIADGVRFGQQLEEVLWETAKRLSLPEFNFFVISLSVQRETGGNLGETLANLSDILRRRKQMKLKIKAMSSEARASAMILGSLPFVMFGIVYAMNPSYASELFTDPRGMMMAAAGVTSMMIGIGVMAKMVRFEI